MHTVSPRGPQTLNCRSKTAQVLTEKKDPHISRPMQFKGQLYFEFKKTFNKIPYILISIMNNCEHDARTYLFYQPPAAADILLENGGF